MSIAGRIKHWINRHLKRSSLCAYCGQLLAWRYVFGDWRQVVRGPCSCEVTMVPSPTAKHLTVGDIKKAIAELPDEAPARLAGLQRFHG